MVASAASDRVHCLPPSVAPTHDAAHSAAFVSLLDLQELPRTMLLEHGVWYKVGSDDSDGNKLKICNFRNTQLP